MTELALTEWLNSRETQALRVYLRRRQALALERFLGGLPVDPVMQGRAAALHELETLLGRTPEDIQKTFETVLREPR